jgi:hypothetical protein
MISAMPPTASPPPFVKLLGIAVLLIAGLVAFLRQGTPANVPSAGNNQAPAAPNPDRRPDGSAASATVPATGAEIRLGSWNIEWLGKPEDRSGPAKGVAQDPADLAAVVVASGVDVLALQEIVVPKPGRPLRSREVEAMLASVEKRTSQRWGYVLFPGRADGDQLTGVAWNTAKVRPLTGDNRPWDQASSSPYALPIARGRSASGTAMWNRPPHAMKFSAGERRTDFVVIVLHMKADYNGDFAAHRREEAAALAGVLGDVTRSMRDQDIVLLGDTNITASDEPALAAFTGAGYRDLNRAAAATTWRGSTMDRIFVPDSQPEFKASRFEVVTESRLPGAKLDAREYKRRYSDHYMVVSSVRVGEDDD